MDIILGKSAGFCFGVKNAVTKTFDEIKKNEGKITFCLGELVHNKQVVEKLESEGMKVINELEEAKGKVIIRAHGTTKENYEFAKNNNIEFVDLTCPKVLKIHKMINEAINNNYFVFLIGIAEHPETIGNKSFGEKFITLVEEVDGIENAIINLKESKKKKVLVISQTTFNIEKFDVIVQKIKEKIDEKEIFIEVKNTICDATKIRQEETAKIAREVELMIIIGGKNSSNTQKLVEISRKYCENVLSVETKKELDIENIKKLNKIGIMAGASTPKESIDDIYKFCNM